MMIEAEIAKKLTKAAALEQMAEEAAELAQAALKLARILREENPTPVTEDAAELALQEEHCDVRVCARVLDEHLCLLSGTTWLENQKMERWLKRLEEKEEK